jgi:hypothetical protein
MIASICVESVREIRRCCGERSGIDPGSLHMQVSHMSRGYFLAGREQCPRMALVSVLRRVLAAL